jgi:hypothetical protein
MPDNPAYQRILAALGDAGTARRARDLCRALDLGIEPKHIEGVRSKLKRLVGRGCGHQRAGQADGVLRLAAECGEASLTRVVTHQNSYSTFLS